MRKNVQKSADKSGNNDEINEGWIKRANENPRVNNKVVKNVNKRE